MKLAIHRSAGARFSITILMIAEVFALSLWFVSAAVLQDMTREIAISPFRQAALSSGVQAGFVIGALASAIAGVADRYDPRTVFSFSAIAAGLATVGLVFVHPGGFASIAIRIFTGAMLAGVYPVGMKIAVGWTIRRRGFLVGALVGALTLGSAFPHMIALFGGVNWRLTILVSACLAIAAGLLVLLTSLGPHHTTASRFDPTAVLTAWRNKRVRYAYGGYLGHMWELYSMWSWIAVATALSYGMSMPVRDAETLSKLTAFLAIAAGGLTSAFAGWIADRIGKAEVAIVALVFSCGSAVAAGATFGGPVWLTFAITMLWGISIIPDSAQFSALVADAAPPDQAGSLMTLQTALGFALTFFTVQITPTLAEIFGWPLVLAGMALGPAFGIYSMMRLRALIAE